jgi:hypothetical protein
LFLTRFLWDELHQQTLTARFAVFRIKVHASGRILENKPRTPGLARQSPVTALLKKLQLELEHIQQVAIIDWHKITTNHKASLPQIRRRCGDWHHWV